MPNITWQLLLELPDLVGGRIEFYQKPENEYWQLIIAGAEIEDESVCFTISEHFMRKGLEGPYIRHSGYPKFRVPLEISVRESTAGKLHYYYQYCGNGFTLYLKEKQTVGAIAAA